jgi:hypothetical protein
MTCRVCVQITQSKRSSGMPAPVERSPTIVAIGFDASAWRTSRAVIAESPSGEPVQPPNRRA